MYNDIYTGDPQDKRFFGIYRGVVTDTADPKGLGRVRLTVPQILGKAVTSWAWPIIGVPENKKAPYGSFSDSTTQNIAAVNTPQVVTINTIEEAFRVSVVDGSKITFANAGTYDIQFSAQLQRTNKGNDTADVWLKLNGSLPAQNVLRSNGSVSINGDANATPQIIAWNYVLTVEAGDYLQFWWRGTDTAIQLLAQPADSVVPATPSFAVTATLVGGFLPIPGDGCWVMFEGGDPNFPLWLGAF
jgi:hypothetical protein